MWRSIPIGEQPASGEIILNELENPKIQGTRTRSISGKLGRQQMPEFSNCS
jgi:hypothetical protein